MSTGPPAGIVVVTGASSGIGEACARRLDDHGWRVVAGVRREEDAERLRKLSSERLLPVRLDVRSGDDLRELAARLDEVAGAGGVQGLVNNAGVVVAGPLACTPLDDIRRQFEINVFGVLAATRALLPLLRRGRGRIVNMGSVAGRITAPFLGPYSASKFALEALSDALRMELSLEGIPVSLVESGPVTTPMWNKLRTRNRALQGADTDDCARRYAAALHGFDAMVGRQQPDAVAPQAVARVVEQALTAARPRARYQVGRGTRTAIILSRLLSDRLRDRLALRRLGIRY